MPKASLPDGLEMYYEFDSFVEPWREPEAMLLVHGIGGSTDEWYAWLPLISGRFAVWRVDLRGWGRSTVPSNDYAWSMDNYAADLRDFMDRVGLRKIHLVGTKLGGRIALHFARAYPERLHSMTLVCTPMTIQNLVPGDSRAKRPSSDEGADAVARWARSTMAERLGDVPAEMLEWWNTLYSAASPLVIGATFDLAWNTDEYSLLGDIRTPTLVIDTVENIQKNRDPNWPSLIAGSKLALIPVTSEGRMIAATKPTECVAALLAFLENLGAAVRH